MVKLTRLVEGAEVLMAAFCPVCRTVERFNEDLWNEETETWVDRPIGWC